MSDQASLLDVILRPFRWFCKSVYWILSDNPKPPTSVDVPALNRVYIGERAYICFDPPLPGGPPVYPPPPACLPRPVGSPKKPIWGCIGGRYGKLTETKFGGRDFVRLDEFVGDDPYPENTRMIPTSAVPEFRIVDEATARAKSKESR